MTAPLSPAAQAMLDAYRDFSWRPDEEDNGRYYKWSHRAGVAAALRAAADQVVPVRAWHESDNDSTWQRHQMRVIINRRILAIAAEMEANR